MTHDYLSYNFTSDVNFHLPLSGVPACDHREPRAQLAIRSHHFEGEPINITTSTVSLTVDDVAASRDYLITHFGYAQAGAADGFASLTRDDAAVDIVLLERGIEVLPEEQRHQRASGLILAFTVTDIAAHEERLRRAGARITMPLREEPWGERLFQVTDPNGIVLQLVEWA
ncbi:VOC family protein [Streptomyces sp. NPDC048506]